MERLPAGVINEKVKELQSPHGRTSGRKFISVISVQVFFINALKHKYYSGEKKRFPNIVMAICLDPL